MKILKGTTGYGNVLKTGSKEIYQHGKTIRGIVVKVLTADGKEGKLPHEFLIFGASALTVTEIDPLHIRCKLNDTAELTLGGRCLLVAHIDLDAILP